MRCRSDDSLLWLRLFAFRCRVRGCGHVVVGADQIYPAEPSPTTTTTPPTQPHTYKLLLLPPHCFLHPSTSPPGSDSATFSIPVFDQTAASVAVRAVCTGTGWKGCDRGRTVNYLRSLLTSLICDQFFVYPGIETSLLLQI